MPICLKGKAVLLTGSTGFIGGYLIGELSRRGALLRTVTHSFANNRRLDLSILSECRQAFSRASAGLPVDAVVHCAGVNGGIGWNGANQYRAYHENTLMALNVLACCVERKISKVLSLVASCAYRPGQELLESDYLLGEPDKSVEGHAWAKRNTLVASRLASQTGSTLAICACPTTVYGPGMPTGEDAKLMGAIMGKVVQAKKEGKDTVTLWGTGTPMREFIHARDCARLLVDILEKYETCSRPINVGTGQEISVWALANKIREAAGWTGEFIWDKDKPDGAPAKRLSLRRMIKHLGPQQCLVGLDEGINECVKGMLSQ